MTRASGGPSRIYLDHNATTPVREEVVAAMVDVLRHHPGNPSSTHAEGAEARRLVEGARRRVASCLGTEPDRVIFTAGATEANNTVLQGMFGGSAGSGTAGRHVITTAIEHPSVDEPLEWLADAGLSVTRLPVDVEGKISLEDLAAAFRPETRLVSVILANNETGVIQPIEAIEELTHARGALLHVDATQAVGKFPVHVREIRADYLACSAHKFGGPKGSGALIVADGAELPGLVLGGGQEKRKRGGTENVAGIVGLGKACELVEAELSARIERYGRLRDRLWDGLVSGIPKIQRNGPQKAVLCNTLNVEFEGVAGEVLLQALDLEGISVSMGAACHSGSVTPSHVLAAMGRTPGQARGSLRLSVGHGNDEDEIDRVVALLVILVARIRGSDA